MNESLVQEIEDSIGYIIARLKQPEKEGGVGADVSTTAIRMIVNKLIEAFGVGIINKENEDELYLLAKSMFLNNATQE